MKKTIFSVAVALLLSSTVCMAQKQRKERLTPEQRMEKMVTDLGLNETQAKQFKEAMAEMRPAKREKGERPSREEMVEKRKKMDEKIKSILTDEQYKKYKSMRPQPRNRQRR